MPSILLKNIPSQIHLEIKARAKRNHRSLNNEIISCLEAILIVIPPDPRIEIEKVRMVRKKIRGYLTEEVLNECKNAGRK